MTASEKGQHMGQPGVRHRRVAALALEPRSRGGRAGAAVRMRPLRGGRGCAAAALPALSVDGSKGCQGAPVPQRWTAAAGFLLRLSASSVGSLPR
jgi:hypothetical protein